MRLFIPAMLVLAACQSLPEDPALQRRLDIERLAANLGDPETDQRIVLHLDEAVTVLVHVLRESTNPVRQGRAARVLGLIYRADGNALALGAYVDMLREGMSAALVGELLQHAHFFDDPEGTVRTLLLAFIERMPTATPEMIGNAAYLAGDEALDAMKAYVYRTRDEQDNRGRDLAIRAIGRAARHGRIDAVEFLTSCTSIGNEGMTLTAGHELDLTCGVNTSRNWRGWWLEHARQGRFEWLAESAWRGRGRAFDPRSIADWDELVLQADPADELEPLFAMIEGGLGIRFGYLSCRDSFDPFQADEVIRERDLRAVAMLKSWWKENGPCFSWNGSSGSFCFDRDRREFGLPRDWTAESDALAAHGDYAGAVMNVAPFAKIERLPDPLRAEVDRQRRKIIEAGRGYFHQQEARIAVVRETQPDVVRQICDEMISSLGGGKVAEFSDEVRKAEQQRGEEAEKKE